MKRVMDLLTKLKDHVTTKAMKSLQDTIQAVNTEAGSNKLDVSMFQTLEDVSRLVTEQQGWITPTHTHPHTHTPTTM